MKFIPTLAFVAAVISPVAASAQVSMSGTWSVSGLIGPSGGINGVTWSPTCVFQQAGDRLAGTCRGPAGVGPAAGAVSGAVVTFQWQYTPGGPIFSGVAGPDGVIRGSVTFDGRTGTFTAARAP
jgi:hypothetical protein